MHEYIYGINQIEAAIESGHKILEFFVKDGKHKDLTDKAPSVPVSDYREIDWVEADIPYGVNTQAIVAKITPSRILSLDELIKRAETKENKVIVLADKITDPHNLGAIIRNISAFNAAGLIIPTNQSAQINSTVHKTSAGNTFHTDIAQIKSMTNAIKKLKDSGYWLVETRMDAKMTLDQLADYDAPIVIVLGSEGSGVSEGVSKKADMSVGIEMLGKAESLNVATTSAIILHKLQK